MKNWIFLHSTGYQNNIIILTNDVILLGLPNAPWNLFPSSWYLLYKRSKSSFRVTVILDTPDVDTDKF